MPRAVAVLAERLGLGAARVGVVAPPLPLPLFDAYLAPMASRGVLVRDRRRAAGNAGAAGRASGAGPARCRRRVARPDDAGLCPRAARRRVPPDARGPVAAPRPPRDDGRGV